MKSKQPRKNWDKSFKKMHKNGDDTLLDSDTLDKLQKEIEEAIEQAVRGELITIDEAFERVLKNIEKY